MTWVVDIAFCVLTVCAGLNFMVLLAAKVYKTLHGVQEYTIVPGKWCGYIPYKYRGEERVMYIINNNYTQVDDDDMRVYGITKDGRRINITPPPGYHLAASAYTLGFESVEIVSGDQVKEYPKRIQFAFPTQHNDDPVNEYPLHAH